MHTDSWENFESHENRRRYEKQKCQRLRMSNASKKCQRSIRLKWKERLEISKKSDFDEMLKDLKSRKKRNIIDEMFRDLQNCIARITRLTDKAYKKLHDKCHVRELLEKSRRFEFWWKTISFLRDVLIQIVRFDRDTRAKHLDYSNKRTTFCIDELASRLSQKYEICCSSISIIFEEMLSRLSLRISRVDISIIFTNVYSSSIQTDHAHEEQTHRHTFEHASNSSLSTLYEQHRTTFSLEKQHERRSKR
jgi:hypothetical protein